MPSTSMLLHIISTRDSLLHQLLLTARQLLLSARSSPKPTETAMSLRQSKDKGAAVADITPTNQDESISAEASGAPDTALILVAFAQSG